MKIANKIGCFFIQITIVNSLHPFYKQLQKSQLGPNCLTKMFIKQICFVRFSTRYTTMYISNLNNQSKLHNYFTITHSFMTHSSCVEFKCCTEIRHRSNFLVLCLSKIALQALCIFSCSFVSPTHCLKKPLPCIH